MSEGEALAGTIRRRPNADGLLTEEQLCKRYSVSRDAVKKARCDPENPLPCEKFLRRYLYDPKKVTAWAEQNAKREWQRAQSQRR